MPSAYHMGNLTPQRKAVLALFAVVIASLLLLTAFEFRSGGGMEIDEFRGGVKSLTFLASYSPTILRMDLKGAEHVKKAILRVRGMLPPNSTFIRVGLRPVSLAEGDFNGDGLPDLAVACYEEGSIHVFLNKKNRKIDFFTPAVYPVGEYPIKLASGD
ncbi:MAG: VCBS repeat-containing protein, partial [Thermoplasmata archaeon]|nr:VCBS repeat-containing protein [Thermoplasmata archaeon]